MTHEDREDREAEALRRRLYSRSASAADVAAYLDRAGADGPPPPEPAPAPSDRRVLLVAGVVGAVALLVAGAVLSGAAAPRSARTIAAASTAARWTSAPPLAAAAGVVDGGARDEAEGAASPATATDTVYATARGDTAAGIAKRFGLCVADVLIALPYGFDPGLLPSGQHLLLHRSESTDRRTGAC